MEGRIQSLGPWLIRKALRRMEWEGVKPDVLVLAGDLIENGGADSADRDLEEIAKAASHAGIPLLVVPGNHDGDPERVARIFGCRPVPHRIGEAAFLVLHDTYDANNVMTRSDAGLRLPAEAAARTSGAALIALQHNPIYPDIDVPSYPYMPANVEAIRRSYEGA